MSACVISLTRRRSSLSQALLSRRIKSTLLSTLPPFPPSAPTHRSSLHNHLQSPTLQESSTLGPNLLLRIPSGPLRTFSRNSQSTSPLPSMCKGYKATYNCGCTRPTKSYYRCRERKDDSVCPSFDSDDIVLTVHLCLKCMEKRSWRLDPEKDCD